MTDKGKVLIGEKTKRGRLSFDDWQQRVRYALRHLEDPIALQRSPLCKLGKLEKLAEIKYPGGVVSQGRALRDLILNCLLEIENELDGLSGVNKLKLFIYHTRLGEGLFEASRSVGVTPEHASRTYKKKLIQLLTEKLFLKLR